MGKSQKQKGRNQEYALRDKLRQMGWVADRVYASGAIKGLPGDVKATKGNQAVLLEMKARKSAFTSIYALYEEHVKNAQDDVLSFCLPGAQKQCILVSTSLDALFDGPEYFIIAQQHCLYAKHKRAFERFATMEKWVKETDVLCIKNDRREILFIRYR